MGREIAVFGQGGDHGHEVRLTGAVVADDQQPLVVHGLVELKLRNDEVDQLLGHLLGDDVGLDKLPGSSGLVGVPQLNHGFDRLELDQISVFHRVCPPCAFVPCLHAMASGFTTRKSRKGYRLYSG